MEKIGACFASLVWFSIEVGGYVYAFQCGSFCIDVACGESIKTEGNRIMAEYFNAYTDNIQPADNCLSYSSLWPPWESIMGIC